jgi:hypothetical protein
VGPELEIENAHPVEDGLVVCEQPRGSVSTRGWLAHGRPANDTEQYQG